MTSKGWARHVVVSEGNLWFNVTEMGERRREGREADKVSELQVIFTFRRLGNNQCVLIRIDYKVVGNLKGELCLSKSQAVNSALC